MPTKAVHMISTVHIDHYCSSVCNRLDVLILWSCRQTGYAPFIDHPPPPLRAWNQWQRNEKSTCLGFQLEDNAKQRSWVDYKPCHYSTVAINSDRGRSASRASRSGFQYNTNPLCTLNALRDQTDKCSNNSIIKLYRNKYHYDKFTQLDPIFDRS